MNNISPTQQVNRNSNAVKASKQASEDTSKKNKQHRSVSKSPSVAKSKIDLPSTFIKISPSLGGLFKGEKIKICILGKMQNQFSTALYKGTQLLLVTNETFPKGKILNFQITKTNHEEAFGYIKNNTAHNLNEKILIRLIVLDTNKEIKPSLFNPAGKNSHHFSWSSLDEIIKLLNGLDTKLAENLVINKLPKLSATSVESFLNYLSILHTGNFAEFLSFKLIKLLKNLGKNDLVEKLNHEFEGQKNSLNNKNSKNIIVPFFFDNAIFPIHYYLKNKKRLHKNNEHIEFLIEFELDNLGPIQFDGSIKYNKLDLVITTTVSLDTDTKEVLLNHFQKILGRNTRPGNIIFKIKNKFMGFVKSKTERIESKILHEIIA